MNPFNPKVFQVLTGLLPFYGGHRPRLVEMWCEVVISVFANLVFLDAFVLDWGQRTVCRVYKKICALGSKQAVFSKELSYWKETELIHIPHSTLWSICSHGSRFDGFQHVITCYNKSLSDPPMIPGHSDGPQLDLPQHWLSPDATDLIRRMVVKVREPQPWHGEVPWHGDTAIGWGSGCAAGLPWFSRTGGEVSRMMWMIWWCGYDIYIYIYIYDYDDDDDDGTWG